MKLVKIKHQQGYKIVQSDGVDEVHCYLSELIELKNQIEDIKERESQNIMMKGIL